MSADARTHGQCFTASCADASPLVCVPGRGPRAGARVHSRPDHDTLTTTEQADHHAFCQPYDVLIRLFKTDIEKTDHNSRGLISVDLPFFYFLGENSTPVV